MYAAAANVVFFGNPGSEKAFRRTSQWRRIKLRWFELSIAPTDE
jgi:hypothetical protein